MKFDEHFQDPRLKALRSQIAQNFGSSFAAKASSRLCSLLHAEQVLEGQSELPAILEFRLTESSDPVWVDGGLTDVYSRRKRRIELRQLGFALATGNVVEQLSGVRSSFGLCWLNRCVESRTQIRTLSELAEDPVIIGIDLPVPISIEGSYVPMGLLAPFDMSEYGCTGKDVVVAVIDSEVKHDHPAFGDRVVQKQNYTNQPWGFPHWHGTAVAGIIGAAGSTWGVAPDCLIWNYKVIPLGEGDKLSDFQGALALQGALEDGAQVANCSWGAGPLGDGRSRIARACEEAWNLGMTVVKSAGNGSLTCPGEAVGIIVVGACDVGGTHVPSYSGRGMTYDSRSLPHLVAPGGTDTAGLHSLDIYDSVRAIGSGTSFAAPWVSGTACRLLEGRADLEPDEIRRIMLEMSIPIPNVDNSEQGAGRLEFRSSIVPGYTASMESSDGTSTD